MTRQDKYEVLRDHGLNAETGRLIREWAREKGFEEDVDELHRVVDDASDEAGPIDEEWYKRMHATIERLFTLAQVALIVSELGEFVEAVRKPGPDDKCPEHSGQKAELADAMIRTLHLDNRIDGAPMNICKSCGRETNLEYCVSCILNGHRDIDHEPEEEE